MKRRIYFFSAIFLALSLPLIIGGIYFKDLYKENEERVKIAKLDANPELFYLSSDVIDDLEDVSIKDSNYESTNSYDFQVVYTSSNELTKKYYLYLTDIVISQNINPETFMWRLFLLDPKTERYKQISSGNFAELTSDYFRISHDLTINLNSVQRFKFYYYLVEDNKNTLGYAGSTFKARLEVE